MNPTVALPGLMTWMGIRWSSGSRRPQSPKGLPLHLLNRFWFVPRADGIGQSRLVKASGFFYLKLPAGHVQEWQPAPRRQYVIGVSGRGEIELADGKKIPMEPGSVILAEDLTGKGHLSRCLGPQDCIVAEVPLAE